MNNDIFDPFDKSVEIEICGERREVTAGETEFNEVAEKTELSECNMIIPKIYAVKCATINLDTMRKAVN